MNNKTSRTCAIKLSQYVLFLLFFFIWLLITFMNIGFHSSKIPIKQDSKPWDSSVDPIYIPHISDTHISPSLPRAVKNLKHVLFDTSNLLHPSFIIHTGDINIRPLTQGLEIQILRIGNYIIQLLMNIIFMMMI